MTGNTWDIIKIQTKTNQLIMGNRTDQIWVRRRRQRKTKSDRSAIRSAQWTVQKNKIKTI